MTEDVGPWRCRTFGHDFEMIEVHNIRMPDFDFSARSGVAICRRCYHEFLAYEFKLLVDGQWITRWRYLPIEATEEGAPADDQMPVDDGPEMSDPPGPAGIPGPCPAGAQSIADDP